MSVWFSIWRKHLDLVSVSILTVGQQSPQNSIKKSSGKNQPHGRVQSDAFRVVEILVQQRDAGLAVLVADKHPIVHVIHKVEVLGQPVDGHLFHI